MKLVYRKQLYYIIQVYNNNHINLLEIEEDFVLIVI